MGRRCRATAHPFSVSGIVTLVCNPLGLHTASPGERPRPAAGWRPCPFRVAYPLSGLLSVALSPELVAVSGRERGVDWPVAASPSSLPDVRHVLVVLREFPLVRAAPETTGAPELGPLGRRRAGRPDFVCVTPGAVSRPR